MADDGLSGRKRVVVVPQGSEEEVPGTSGEDMGLAETGLALVIDTHMHIQSIVAL